MMTETMDTKKKAAFHEGPAFHTEGKLGGIRLQARQALEQMEFPSSREEYWKYSRISRLKKLPLVSKAEVAPLEEFNNYDLVFVNGILVKSPKGTRELKVSDLNGDLHRSIGDFTSNYFLALNAAALTSGIAIEVPAGLQQEYPISILVRSVGANQLAQPRLSIDWGKGAHADINVRYETDGNESCFTNMVIEGKMEANASGSVNQLQQPGANNYLITQIDVDQARDSRLELNTFSINGSFIRNNINVRSGGENCETSMNGIYLPKGDEHMDNHTFVDHAVAHCRSEENYKGVLADRASGVFNGKVMVRQDAQKIEAFQSNQNIVLSDDAGVNSKPELEIYADDVRCSHGSTTGQLDEEPLFYLQSRGIPANKARQLLVEAFVYDVVEKMTIHEFRQWVEEVIEKRQEEELSA